MRSYVNLAIRSRELETWDADGGLSPPYGVKFFVVRDGTGYCPGENRESSSLCAYKILWADPLYKGRLGEHYFSRHLLLKGH